MFATEVWRSMVDGQAYFPYLFDGRVFAVLNRTFIVNKHENLLLGWASPWMVSEQLQGKMQVL